MLRTERYPSHVSLSKERISFKPTIIERDWWAWLPEAKNTVRFHFKICGIECWWKSQKNKHIFTFQGKEKKHEKSLIPDMWYHFSITTDFQKRISYVFIDDNLIFDGVPLMQIQNETELSLDDIKISGFFFEDSTGWVDNIKISYSY